MNEDALFESFKAGFKKRKFSAGLLVSLIDFLVELGVPEKGYFSFDEFLEAYPRLLKTSGGQTANTLIVQATGRTLSLRPFYNAAERYYRAENKRFDYPSAAPHATQAWTDYINWLDALVGFDAATLKSLRDRTNEFVLDTLPSQAFDPSSIEIEPPLFRIMLTDFEMAARSGEPTGGSFQGIVFGFLRADNPHLQIEIDKVRTGSKRLQRIGDVDGWDGHRLAISAEVKQKEIRAGDVSDLKSFAHETGIRGALGVIAALSFEAGVRDILKADGLIPIDKDDMVKSVELWDPIKQRTAVSSFVYYVAHVEKNASLNDRVTAFLEKAANDWTMARKAAIIVPSIAISDPE